MARFGHDEGAAPDHRTGSGLMPAGQYVGMVIDSDVVDNSAGTGKILKLTYELLNAGFEGRQVWQNINVQNASATAQRIAQAELANLKEAAGITGRLEDTVQLHNIPVGLRLEIEIGGPKKGGAPGETYKDKNVVADNFPAAEFVPAGDEPAPAPRPAAVRPVAPAPAPAPAPAAPAQAPWMRKAAA